MVIFQEKKYANGEMRCAVARSSSESSSSSYAKLFVFVSLPTGSLVIVVGIYYDPETLPASKSVKKWHSTLLLEAVV